jgi:hypothetical protein
VAAITDRRYNSNQSRLGKPGRLFSCGEEIRKKEAASFLLSSVSKSSVSSECNPAVSLSAATRIKGVRDIFLWGEQSGDAKNFLVELSRLLSRREINNVSFDFCHCDGAL